MPYKLTDQQNEIIELAKAGEQVIITKARAGTSKSYTGKKVSEAVGTGPQLYIVYSKALQLEAQKDLSNNVRVTTLHSYAYGPVMSQRIKLHDSHNTKKRELIFLKAATLSHIKNWDIRYAVLDGMEKYFASNALDHKTFFKSEYYDESRDYIIETIDNMFEGRLGMTHSGYLKYYHLLLAAGKLDNLPTYDLLIYDELQDGSEVALAIVSLTKTHQWLFLGDDLQAITASFAHTTDGFKALEGIGVTKELSKSFRVNLNDARRVQDFCQLNLDPEMHFVGMEYDNTVVKTHGFLSRTNAGLIRQMIHLIAEDKPFSVTRDPKRIFTLPLILASLKKGYFVKVPEYKFLQTDLDTYLRSPKLQATYSTPLKYVMSKHSTDQELTAAVSLLLKYGPGLIIEANNMATKYYKAGNKSDTWLSTAHSSKGLTFDKVTLLNDMNEKFDKMLEKYPDRLDWGIDQKAEAMLYYVACTRHRYEIENAKYLKD